MNRLRRWPLKPILILAYLGLSYSDIRDRVISIGVSPGLLIYAALFALLAAGILLAAQIRNPVVRILWATVFATASIFQQSFEWTTDGPLTYDNFINLYNARGNVDEALAQHGAVLRLVIPLAILLFAGVALPPRRRAIPAWVAQAGPLVALAILSGLIYQRGGEGTRGLPAAYPPIAYSAFMAAETLMAEHGPRRAIAIPRKPIALKRDIVLIVDESIAANYLDIDNPAGVPTGLRSPPPGISITNFGYAASVHNCSATSNVVLRYGGTRDDYQQTIAHYPSIWAYAKHAGLRTVYIDAQSTGGHLQNLMTPAERAEIDEFIQFDKVPVVGLDMAVADAIAAHINNGRPEFIYVNKIGAHFPVDDKYPEAMTRYRPALDRTHHGLLTWTSDRTGFHGLPAEWVRYRNSYRNLLMWNVGSFFQRLFREADFSKATAIYTSDHGQDLHEHGNPGNNTHCGANRALPQEGLVPLLVIEGRGTASRDWDKSLPVNHDALSHFRIFPTLLELMGYNGVVARPTYGPPIDDPAKDDFSFNMLFNTRLGRKPEWQRIDLSKIIVPPASDYGGTAPPVPSAATH
jgi:glucan phosphoethanolaminetransferase (alkaline phosphatase superfamily)